LFLLASGLSVSIASAADARMLIVRFAAGASPDAVARRYNCRVLDRAPGAPFALLRALSPSHAERVQIQMAVDPLVVWSEDNEKVSSPENQRLGSTMVTRGGSVPAVGDRFKLVSINSAYLQQINWTSTVAAAPGRTVRVAILDTGLASQQTALWSKVVAEVNLIEPGTPAYDRPTGVDSNQNGFPDEGVGHGSMVAGLVDVVSPNTQLVIARICDSDGNATAWTIIKGLAFAATSGAEIANVSLGSLAQITALSDTMEWCESQRLLVVASIGNDSLPQASYPGRISRVVCVAGLNADDTKASFSNWDGKADVAAPAVGLASQYWDGGLAVWSGTSFAAPLVTGAIAEYVRRAPTRLSPNVIRTAVDRSVDNIDSINPTYTRGLGGRLNVTRLVDSLLAP
jgi:subtilisin family serine protease